MGGSSVCPRGVWSLSLGLPKPPTGAKRPSCTPSSPPRCSGKAVGWQLGWVLCSPGWGIPSTPPGGRRTKVSAGWGGGHRERGVRGVRGAGGAWGGGGNTHIHYDSHASNESNKVKGESPTGKRKQTVLRRAPGSGREEDGPTGPASRTSHPPGQLPAERVPPEPSPGQRDGDIRQEWGQGEGGLTWPPGIS